MNTKISYSDFTDITHESSEIFEPYGCSDTSESLQRIYNYIQAYKAGFSDREYVDAD